MEPHSFHRAIGRLINPKDFPKYETLEILKDPSCDPKGQRISLYKQGIGTPVRYCDVDILVATDKKLRVIIEIEESNVKPIQIFGKFFASAFSDFYMGKGIGKNRYHPIVVPVLFIQVLDSSKLKEGKSKKPGQWENIEKQIQDFLKKPFGIITEYGIFRDGGREFESRSGEAKRMINAIERFLAKIPRENIG